MLEILPIKQVLYEVLDHLEGGDNDQAHAPLPDGDGIWHTMVHLAGHLALAGHSTLLISCRGSGIEVGKELLAGRTGIAARFLSRIDYDGFCRIISALAKLAKTPLYFLEIPGWEDPAPLEVSTTRQFRFIVLDSPLTPAIEESLLVLSTDRVIVLDSPLTPAMEESLLELSTDRVAWLTPIG